jgi:hypothetical protein
MLWVTAPNVVLAAGFERRAPSLNTTGMATKTHPSPSERGKVASF